MIESVKPKNVARSEKGLWKRGDSYWADVTYQGDRIREPLSTDKKQAMLKLSKLRVALENGEYRKNTAAEINEVKTVGEIIDKYLEIHSKVNCKKSYKKCDLVYSKPLKEHFGELEINSVKLEDGDEYKALRIADNLSSTTVNHELRLLKSVLNKAVEWGYLNLNPFKYLKKFPKKQGRLRFLTYEEYDKLMTLADSITKDWIEWSTATGLRPDESCKISIKTDINFKRKQVFLGNTKNGDSIWHPLNETALKVIKRQTSDTPFKIDYYKRFIKVRDEAGLGKDVIPYTCRHTFASWLAMAGVPIFDIQKLMRHKDVTQTLIYAHLAPSHLADDVLKIDTFLSERCIIQAQK